MNNDQVLKKFREKSKSWGEDGFLKLDKGECVVTWSVVESFILSTLEEQQLELVNLSSKTPDGFVTEDFHKEKLEEQESVYRDCLEAKEKVCVKVCEKQAQLHKDSIEREKWYDNLVQCKIYGKHSSVKDYIEHLEAEAQRHKQEIIKAKIKELRNINKNTYSFSFRRIIDSRISQLEKELAQLKRELPCPHDVAPFDNDKTCIHCGKDMRVGQEIERLPSGSSVAQIMDIINQAGTDTFGNFLFLRRHIPDVAKAIIALRKGKE